MSVLERVNSDLQVVNTTTETSVFSASVPADAMSSDGMVLVTLLAEYVNNSAGAATEPTLKVKFGGVTIYQDAAAAFEASSNTRPLFYQFALVNQGVSDQTGGGLLLHGNFGTATTGAGDLTQSYSLCTGVPAIALDGSVDTSSAQTLEVTWQHGNASPNISFTRKYAVAELVGEEEEPDTTVDPEPGDPPVATNGDTLCVFLPLSNEPPSSSFATLTFRNSHPSLSFGATTDSSAIFRGILPRHYNGGGLTVTLCWVAETAITGNVVWAAVIERIGVDHDIDADGFAADPTVVSTAPGVLGAPAYAALAFDPGTQMDSLAIGEMFRLKISRDADNASDTMSGASLLLGVEIAES